MVAVGGWFTVTVATVEVTGALAPFCTTARKLVVDCRLEKV